MARRSIEKALRRHEGEARFGNTLFHDTPAEQFCIEVLHGAARDKLDYCDKDESGRRLKARPEVMPHTLSDCLHELTYRNELCRLRSAHQGRYGDPAPEATARD